MTQELIEVFRRHGWVVLDRPKPPDPVELLVREWAQYADALRVWESEGGALA